MVDDLNVVHFCLAPHNDNKTQIVDRRRAAHGDAIRNTDMEKRHRVHIATPTDGEAFLQIREFPNGD